MRGWMRTGILCGALGLSGALLPCNAAAQTLGLFTQGSDVGTPSTIGPGSSQYDASTKSYTVTGGGENMPSGCRPASILPATSSVFRSTIAM